ncbi:MAG: hypothetical protein HC842_00240 [Cytophagales bacterium]|nr:hypothetical protein [Cytophagales bacterium]
MIDYSADISKSVFEGMPPHKRKARRLALIGLYLHDLRRQSDDLVAFAESTRERVQMSCETIQLEWLLNREFDTNFSTNWPFTKPIYIVNETIRNDAEFYYTQVEGLDEVYRYALVEDMQLYSQPFFSYRSDEFEQTISAKVYYAADMGLTSEDMTRLRGLLARYIFLGKRYIIIQY